MPNATRVVRNLYRDSVSLMQLADAVSKLPGVAQASVLMASAANLGLMRDAGLVAGAVDAGANDLLIAVRAKSEAALAAALDHAERALKEEPRAAAGGGPAELPPRSIEMALAAAPGANLALVSTPGEYAAAEAMKALRLGLHVMLFSDNVVVEDEVSLKRLATKRGLLLMGPDCGTAILNGVPLGFANAVPRGRVGLVAASGTGLQQVACLLAARGEGISQAIGVGARDMTEKVGGLMTLQALDALGADPATELIIVIGKPPSPSVQEQVQVRLRAISKPGVLALLGREVREEQEGELRTVATMEDAAEAALAALHGVPWAPRPFGAPREEIHRRVLAIQQTLAPQQRGVRGLYAGGTLAHEATLVLESLLGAVATNLIPGSTGHHRVLDLGADEFTVGRPHPMLDSTLRVEAIRLAAREPQVAVLLLDVVLGYGAAPDPAGDIAPALEAARADARAEGRDLAIVASVIGTPGDPQGIESQTARLEAAGAWLLPSNAQAVRAAACIAGGDPIMRLLFEPMEATER